MSPLARLLLVATVVLAGCSSSAQDNLMNEAVNAEVKKMVQATIDGKYEVVLSMTHPNALEEVGDKDKFAGQLKAVMEAIKEKGLIFTVTEIGKPTVTKGDKDYFAVAPYTLEVTGLGKKITCKTAAIGVSADTGKTWKFINIDAKGENEIRRLLPDLPRDLKVPKQESKTETL